MADSQEKFPTVLIRSCKEESLLPREGKLSGSVPTWLEGTLLRDGPGLFQVGPDEYQHWFDGLALLHRFNIKGGKITYQNRFLKSNSYQRNMKAGRIIVSEFGTTAHPDPCASIFDKIRSKFTLEFSDNANINVMKIGDGIYVATETNYITRIDPETLETKEKVDLKKLVSVNTCTAHPHYASDGALLNMGSSIGALSAPVYCIIRFPSDGEKSFQNGSVLCRIPCSRPLYPSYYHSFGLTENFVVFVEQSLVISVPKMAWNHLSSGAYINGLQWQPQQMVRFHLVRRSTGELLPNHFVGSPFLVFHHVNAFESEDGKEVVMDLCAYKDDAMIKALFLKDLREQQDPMEFLKKTESKTLRFVLPLEEYSSDQISAKTNLVKLPGSRAKATPKEDGTIFCEPENMSEGLLTFDLPQINYSQVNGKKYDYVYGVARPRDEPSQAGLAKVDLLKRSHVMWVSPGHIPSEPVFVPRPQATEEDDGVLLCSVLSEADEQQVALVILDARSMKEVAKAEFQCPSAVPSDLHGKFLH